MAVRKEGDFDISLLNECETKEAKEAKWDVGDRSTWNARAKKE